MESCRKPGNEGRGASSRLPEEKVSESLPQAMDRTASVATKASAPTPDGERDLGEFSFRPVADHH